MTEIINLNGRGKLLCVIEYIYYKQLFIFHFFYWENELFRNMEFGKIIFEKIVIELLGNNPYLISERNSLVFSVSLGSISFTDI